MTLLILLAIFYGLPMWLCCIICESKNRNSNKGIFLGLVFGWVGVLGLWLALKTRDLNTKMLY